MREKPVELHVLSALTAILSMWVNGLTITWYNGTPIGLHICDIWDKFGIMFFIDNVLCSVVLVLAAVLCNCDSETFIDACYYVNKSDKF